MAKSAFYTLALLGSAAVQAAGLGVSETDVQQFTEKSREATSLGLTLQRGYSLHECARLADDFNLLEERHLAFSTQHDAMLREFPSHAERSRDSGAGLVRQASQLNALISQYRGGRPFVHAVLEISCNGRFTTLSTQKPDGTPAKEIVSLPAPAIQSLRR